MGQEIDYRAIMQLKACKDRLTMQQYRTLRGQVIAGNSEAAMKGLHTILSRQGKGAETSGEKNRTN